MYMTTLYQFYLFYFMFSEDFFASSRNALGNPPGRVTSRNNMEKPKYLYTC